VRAHHAGELRRGPDHEEQLRRGEPAHQGHGGVRNRRAARPEEAELHANGKLETLTDAENNKSTFDYDGLDRLSKLRFPVAAKGQLQSSTTDYEQYGYDAIGNRTSLRKRDGQLILYSFDALNRMIVKDVPGTQDVSYQYDLQGLQTGATFTGSGEGVTSAFDGFGRATSSTSSMGGTARTLGYQYDLGGNRTRVTHPDGTYFSYDHDGGQVTAIRESGGTALASYAYDAQGRRSMVTRSNGAVTSYGYDAVSRLTGLTHDLAGSANDLTLTFSHSPASQIVSNTRSNDAYAWIALANASTASAANGLNQMTNQGASALTYDANGNMTSDGSTTFAYDVENRLVSASGAKNAALAYDPLGRLSGITAGGNTTRFLYDGDRLVEERDGAGNLVRRHVHGPGVDEPIATYESATLRHLHADERGSVIAFTDAAGNVTNVNRYNEYGVPAATNVGRFQYTGQAWLPEIGRYYYKSRMYDPKRGAFDQFDTVGYDAGPNGYGYVHADPVNATDPAGTCTGSRIENPDGTCKGTGGYTQSFADYRGGTRPTYAGPNGAGSGRGIGDNGGPPIEERVAEGIAQRVLGWIARRVPIIGLVWSSPAADGVRTDPPLFLVRALNDPASLRGMNPSQLEQQLGENPGWRVTRLYHGDHTGQGWVYRQFKGDEPTGRQIRWHPGGGRHGDQPYWRVNAGHGQSEMIPAGEW
jgi:RHS repeat-associated protein